MRYSIEPIDRRHVKDYGFLSFVKSIGKTLSTKCSQTLIDSAKKSAADAIKTASKRAIHETAEATGDLIDNKIADKFTSTSTELHSKNLQIKLIMKYQRKDIYLHEKDNKLLMNLD